ncbi:MAG: glutamate--cysteine ligase [Proteobacteria bacterium]|nr:MAG: glutamate--cysteine ligase [Pseudomonadota bacterium]
MSDRLHLFEGYGIEMEYMIVDKTNFNVLPITDKVIEALSGEIRNDFSFGAIDVSNELVLHVIEFKCNGPQKDLVKMQKDFEQQIVAMNKFLEQWNAVLLPTAMHPWMHPDTETKLWPHGQNEIYASYNRIFDCRGHGWSNLQSVHINLPFADDEEFGRLHAAIRIVLPLLPGLAASSPLVEGKVTGRKDSRLGFYMENQRRIPSIIGTVIPERVFTEADYERVILQKIYKDIAPQDPDEILQDEWLNSRGAIARFQRNAIEIRVLDIQEAPVSDFAVIALTVSLVKSLVDEKWLSFAEQKTADENELRKVFKEASEQGIDYLLTDGFLLKTFGEQKPVKLRDLWSKILGSLSEGDYEIKNFVEPARELLKRGDLATRILKNLGESPSASAIKTEYQKLAQCLVQGQFYG